MGHPRIHSVLLGLLIIALGAVWLLRNLGIVNTDIGKLIATYWPLLLIVWGLDSMYCALSPPRQDGHGRSHAFPSVSVVFGLILVALGVSLIGRNLGLYSIDLDIIWRLLWPILIILIGWSLIRGPLAAGGTHWAVMSGIECKAPGWSLENGSYVAFMGGINLDLTKANIPDGTTTLSLTAIMGGIDVKVPADLALECQGTAVLGGVTFLGEESAGIVSSRVYSRPGANGTGKKLVIDAWTIMGGIGVK
ncbi:MAG TPA: cell wall-active antibiotics response protein [Firmicutes bacterium]|nr:cell wall-active antibiotics response protein [Bacillota bacterium]